LLARRRSGSPLPLPGGRLEANSGGSIPVTGCLIPTLYPGLTCLGSTGCGEACAAVSSILTVTQDHVSPSQLDTAVSDCCDWASFALLALFPLHTSPCSFLAWDFCRPQYRNKSRLVEARSWSGTSSAMGRSSTAWNVEVHIFQIVGYLGSLVAFLMVNWQLPTLPAHLRVDGRKDLQNSQAACCTRRGAGTLQ